MTVSPLRIIQVSDIHLLADSKGELLGVPTAESFLAVVNLIKANEKKLDFIVLSGDLAQDGSEAAYKRIAVLLKDLNVPAYWVPGNHDDAKVMSRVYPYENISNDKHIVLKNWHVILLNSQKPGAVDGYLDHTELHYLEHCLQANPEHHALIFFHHQPTPVGSAWLDNLGLKNAADLAKIITRYPKVHSIVFGHVHQEFAQTWQGIPCYAVPSTCIQFKPQQNHFGLDDRPPGYRWIELFPDGHLETGVVRTAKYIGIFDKHAKGY